MAFVAATAALFALGAYAGRNLSNGAVFIGFIAAFVCLIAMRFTAARSPQATVALLGAFGLLMGIAMSPTLVYYATANPKALWQAGAATALFIGALGSAGYATERDLSSVARVSFWGLVALLVFGVFAIFVNIPHASVIYSVAGLVIFAGFAGGLPAPAPDAEHRLGAAAGRVDLSGHPQRVLVLPHPVRRERPPELTSARRPGAPDAPTAGTAPFSGHGAVTGGFTV